MTNLYTTEKQLAICRNVLIILSYFILLFSFIRIIIVENIYIFLCTKPTR